MDSVKRLIETIGGKKSICPKEAAAQERRARSLICSNCSTSEALPGSRIRLVFSRDSDKKTLLFDSQASVDSKEKVNESLLSWSMCDVRCGDKLEQSSGSNNSNGWKRLPCTRQTSTDSQLLGEMIFGSTPMKLHGDTLKVHYVKSTDQLMLTKVFSIRRRPLSSCNLSESDSLPVSSVSVSPRESYSPMTRMSEASLTRHQLFVAKTRSNSLNVPSSSSDQGLGPSSYNTSPTTLSTHSPSASLGSNIAMTTPSSLNKRIQRARSTSTENWSYSNLSKKMPKRGVKFALAVIVCLSDLDEKYIRKFQHFIFQHFSLIDAHLNELRESTEDAFVTLRQEAFREAMEQAYQKFRHDFLCLYSAQRIENPVWLSLVSQEANRKVVCRQFMDELGAAITELDTKETKFFLSSVLTEVLSHHLAWIHTVSDLDTSRQSRKSKSLSVLVESHPYNPLWAQLGDLYGAVAAPLTISRTVVTGQMASVVCRLLYILSYFIRCSEIQLGREFKADASQGAGALSSSSSLSTSAPPPRASVDKPRWNVGSDLEASDVFEESRGSSLTLLSEHDRSSVPAAMSPAGLSGRDVPLVKPHPFSFRSIGSDLTRTSRDDSDSQISSPSEHSMKLSQRLSLEHASSASKVCSSPLSVEARTAPSTATVTPTSTIMTTPTSHTPLQRHQPEAFTENKRSSSVVMSHHLEHIPSAQAQGSGQNCQCHDKPNPYLNCSCHEDLPPAAEVMENGKCSIVSRSHVLDGPSQKSILSDSFFSKSNGATPTNGSCHDAVTTQAKDAQVQLPLENRADVGTMDNRTPVDQQPTTEPQLQVSSEYGHRFSEAHAFSNSVDSGYEPSCAPLSRCSTLSSHLSSYRANEDSLLEEEVLEEDKWTDVVHLPSLQSDGLQSDLDPCLSLLPSLDSSRCVTTTTTTTSRSVRGVFGRPSYMEQCCVEGDSPKTAGIALLGAKATDAVVHTDQQKPRPPPSSELFRAAGTTPGVSVSLPVDGQSRDTARRLNFDSLPARDYRWRKLSDTSSVEVDVEKCVPSGGALQCTTSLLDHELELYNRSLEVGAVPRMNQFAHFVPVSLPNLQDFDLEEEEAIFDFGHSLLVGHSTSYLPDFVLHGTSQPYSTFKDDLISDLTSVIKHSIIDEPIEHGLAVIASTDTWTSQLLCVSNGAQSIADTSVTVPSQYIQQLLRSVKTMWEMTIPSEFCLSHLEDGLLALNEKGKLLADALKEKGCTDIGDEVLSRVQGTLSINGTDLPLLLSLAAVHCTDTAMASSIRRKSLQVNFNVGRKISR